MAPLNLVDKFSMIEVVHLIPAGASFSWPASCHASLSYDLLDEVFIAALTDMDGPGAVPMTVYLSAMFKSENHLVIIGLYCTRVRCTRFSTFLHVDCSEEDGEMTWQPLVVRGSGQTECLCSFFEMQRAGDATEYTPAAVCQLWCCQRGRLSISVIL
jgi:hypothetical protein